MRTYKSHIVHIAALISDPVAYLLYTVKMLRKMRRSKNFGCHKELNSILAVQQMQSNPKDANTNTQTQNMETSRNRNKDITDRM